MWFHVLLSLQVLIIGSGTAAAAACPLFIVHLCVCCFFRSRLLIRCHRLNSISISVLIVSERGFTLSQTDEIGESSAGVLTSVKQCRCQIELAQTNNNVLLSNNSVFFLFFSSLLSMNAYKCVSWWLWWWWTQAFDIADDLKQWLIKSSTFLPNIRFH